MFLISEMTTRGEKISRAYQRNKKERARGESDGDGDGDFASLLDPPKPSTTLTT